MIFTVCLMEQLGLEISITITSNNLTGISDVFPCNACRYDDNSEGGKVKGGEMGRSEQFSPDDSQASRSSLHATPNGIKGVTASRKAILVR